MWVMVAITGNLHSCFPSSLLTPGAHKILLFSSCWGCPGVFQDFLWSVTLRSDVCLSWRGSLKANILFAVIFVLYFSMFRNTLEWSLHWCELLSHCDCQRTLVPTVYTLCHWCFGVLCSLLLQRKLSGLFLYSHMSISINSQKLFFQFQAIWYY